MRFATLFGGLAAAAALAATPAAAVTIVGTTATGGNTVTPAALTSSQISVDFDIAAFSPITTEFGIEAGDAVAYDFDSFLSIFTGVNAAASGVATLVLGLTNGATFTLGNVTPDFSVATTSLNASGDAVTIRFAPSETSGVILGSVQNQFGDFRVNRNGLTTGQGFALTVTAAAVPEMSTWAMMVAGLALTATGLRRTRGLRRFAQA